MEEIRNLLMSEHTDFWLFLFINIIIFFYASVPIFIITVIIALCKEQYQKFKYKQKINLLIKDYKKNGGTLSP